MQMNITELVEIDLKFNLTIDQSKSKTLLHLILLQPIVYLLCIAALNYQSYHIYGGMPQGGGGSGSCVLTNKDSVDKYSTTLHIPLWSAYRLNRDVCYSIYMTANIVVRTYFRSIRLFYHSM